MMILNYLLKKQLDNYKTRYIWTEYEMSIIELKWWGDYRYGFKENKD